MNLLIIGLHLDTKLKLFNYISVKSDCNVGAFTVFGREIVESFYRCCLYCGIDICSEKPEVIPGQWEFKTGPTKSIKAADDLWTARWLLMRIAEDYGVGISFHPKILPNWGGSGRLYQINVSELIVFFRWIMKHFSMRQQKQQSFWTPYRDKYSSPKKQRTTKI